MRISIGKSRKDTKWKVKDVTWEQLCSKLSKTYHTHETMAEYKAMTKAEKAEIKDIGGFVGGVVEGGRRLKGSVHTRSLITLDADYAVKGIEKNAPVLMNWAMCFYSTHSHTAKAPRLRILLPLNREVTDEEYEPIARMVAKDFGIEQFDVTTYEVNRLMYWPSTPKDGEYVYVKGDGDYVDADEVLGRYTDWHDVREWPTSSLETSVRDKRAKAQGDPLSKPGLVGLFNRTYDIHRAIETFLSDVYEPCDQADRYTFTGGSSTAGVVIYQDGLFAYSHHATDPAGGMLCNAFDLVRVHKFGELDYSVDSETPVNQRPSYKSMCDFARNDAECRKLSVTEQLEGAREAFAESVPVETEDDDWMKKLEVNRNGKPETTTNNLVLILENDPNLKGSLALNEFTDRLCIVDNVPWKRCEDYINGSPWTDGDEAALRHYVETTYGIYNTAKLADARDTCMLRHKFHPIRDWLSSLNWDGQPRAERLFTDALGAGDDLYTRTVTRKWLTAAVARVFEPGVKFDPMVVLVGDQGIGKSYLGSKLGSGWFSDTFYTVQGKEAYEQLKGAWIIEVGELSAMKRAEVESVKMFVSKQEDSYRAAYGRFTKVNKRQCVFYGTTNDDMFLSDRTGNRRFWPIQCGKTDRHEIFNFGPDYIEQVWAEAVGWYKAGEPLWLNSEVDALAREMQSEYMVEDPRLPKIIEYLDTPIPANWEKLKPEQRRNYIQGFADGQYDDQPLVRRDAISVVEIVYELFGDDMQKSWEARDYHSLMAQVPGWKKTKKRKRTVYGIQRMYERSEE